MRLLQGRLPPIPNLETPRLQLRAHTELDLPVMAAMWADPAVVRYLGSPPQSSQETWIRYLRYLGHWAHFGYGYWAVEERATGRFIGEAGFADYHRLTIPHVDLAPEIGWVLAAEAHGRGFATEIARAMLAWAETSFGAARSVRCFIEKDHTASRNVALKCGFTDLTTVKYQGSPAWILELRSSDKPESVGSSSILSSRIVWSCLLCRIHSRRSPVSFHEPQYSVLTVRKR